MANEAQAANNRWHAYRTEVATRIAEKHFAAQLECVRTVNEALEAGGIGIRLDVCHSINDQRVEISIFNAYGVAGNKKFEQPLTSEDAAEFEASKPGAEELYKEWQRIQKLGEDAASEAARKEAEDRVPLDKDALLALVKQESPEGRGTSEDYYVQNGPGKHGQDDYTGVQVVEMNLGLLRDWIGDDVEDFEALPKADRREIWEASSFHWGINGYEDADANHYWEHEESK